MKQFKQVIPLAVLIILSACGDKDESQASAEEGGSESSLSSQQNPSISSSSNSSQTSSTSLSSATVSSSSSISSSSSADNSAKIERAKAVISALNDWSELYTLREDFLEPIASPFGALAIADFAKPRAGEEYSEFLEQFYTSSLIDSEAVDPLLETLAMAAQTLFAQGLNIWGGEMEGVLDSALVVQDVSEQEDGSLVYRFQFDDTVVTCGLHDSICAVELDLSFEVTISDPSQAQLTAINTDYLFGGATSTAEGVEEEGSQAELTFETDSNISIRLSGGVQNEIARISFSDIEQDNLSASALLASLYQNDNEGIRTEGIRFAMTAPAVTIPFTISELSSARSMSVDIPFSIFGNQFDIAFEHHRNMQNSGESNWRWIIQSPSDFQMATLGKFNQEGIRKINYDAIYGLQLTGETPAIYSSKNCSTLFCMGGDWNDPSQFKVLDSNYTRAMLWNVPNQEAVAYTHTSRNFSDTLKQHTFSMPIEDGNLTVALRQEVESKEIVHAGVYSNLAGSGFIMEGEAIEGVWAGEIKIGGESVGVLTSNGNNLIAEFSNGGIQIIHLD